jgi:hypothetical protein
MKASSMLLVVLILAVPVLAMVAPQATAHNFHYRKGMGIRVDSEQWLSFQRPGDYRMTLMVVVWPLWYFQEGLATYDTVTLNLTLHPYRLLAHGAAPILFGDNCEQIHNWDGNVLQCTWRNVHLSQDEDGITLDATLYLGIEVTVLPSTGTGLYLLEVDGIAAAPGLLFEGHTFAHSLLVYDAT